ncbi:MAG TPA: M23 family metallopeptidase, partial [Candidatus Methylomirabilis sp.]|nr:M23 family metallopeptidase [Candidatus Methylomirabilis sp.]
MKHRLLLPFFVVVPALLLGWGSLPLRAFAAHNFQVSNLTPTPQVTPTPGHIVSSGVLVQAVQEAAAARPDVLAFAINQIQVDHIDLSADGSTALISLTAVDPQTGQPVGREPGLAVASLNPIIAKTGNLDAQADPSAWNIAFQSDPNWQAQFDSLPPDLKPQEYQMAELAAPTQAESITGITLGGYLLPWAGGQAKTLTWSVSHASCAGEDCRYAFDWWDGTHFPLLAAKGGTVFAAVWNYPNDDHTAGHTNYLVLMDTSTTPVSYQIYYHMEQNSIPEALRVKGAFVQQGQYIGRADNTGASTGPHLHFMVHTNPFGLWGQSVDITFRDVRVNWDNA